MTSTVHHASAAGRSLPQMQGKLFLSDGGLETTLLFQDGVDLRCFAAIDMFNKDGGRAHLARYFETYLAIAREAGTGFILESATWRASPDWAGPLDLTQDELDAFNREAIEMLRELKTRYESPDTPIVVSGCIGPRGDGYDPGQVMRAEEAQAYHSRQIGIFSEAGVDMIAAITMTNVPEATGIVRAAQAVGLPTAISFTVETDGRLPTGDALGEAIAAVDEATGAGPAYYMINCAHPSHFDATLAQGGAWTRRIGGIRANASRKSHAELDNSTELDCGDPDEFGAQYGAIVARHPQIRVLGGCCGTDHRHLGAVAAALCGGGGR